MKVICIDSEIYLLKNSNQRKYDSSDFYLSPELTLYKVYNVIKALDTSFVIINDKGETEIYKKDKFITIEEHREKVLTQLGIE